MTAVHSRQMQARIAVAVEHFYHEQELKVTDEVLNYTKLVVKTRQVKTCPTQGVPQCQAGLFRLLVA